jgi:hypothetical protein
VSVTLDDGTTARTTSTASSPAGAYVFTDVAPGSYTLTFVGPGLRRQVLLISVAAGDVLARDADLAAL